MSKIQSTRGSRCPGVQSCSWCASFAADSRHAKAQEVVAGDRTGALGHLERAFWNSGRNLYQHVFKSLFAGMKLTQRWPRFYKQTHCEVESVFPGSSARPDHQQTLLRFAAVCS